jgi:uncharacterized protein (TIGR03067 family)
MRWGVLTVLSVILPGIADAPCGDRARLQGTWRVVAMRSNGEPIHDAGGLDDTRYFQMLDFRFTFDGDRLTETVNFQGFGERHGEDTVVTFAIDQEANPKALDIRRVRGSSVSVQKAIYEFKAERLRICFGAKDRPRSFDARRGSDDLLYEFERVKGRSRDQSVGRGSGLEQ